MDDVLRVACRAEGFLDAMHLQLFDANTALRAKQQVRLGRYHPYWADEVDAVSDDPLIVIANEFFDALPIRQFVRAADGWHERLVGLRDGRRKFGLSPTRLSDETMPPAVRMAQTNAIYEAGLAARDVVLRLGQRLAAQGGALLAIDYGHATTRTGETLQALRRHAYADPLDRPGETDISAHVDFGALRAAARKAGLEVAPLATQGDFLRRLGIDERAGTLARANPDAAAAVEAARIRLTASAEMGELFKVFCAYAGNLTPLGFA
jgi:NADH dehydrogenase [ubiquinone] 1 alpha subcomplex assembly factor 7